MSGAPASISYTSASTFGADVLRADRPVVVDVTADWCPPCRAMAPVLNQIAAARDDIAIVKLDADRDPELVTALGVQGFPTFLVFRDGEIAGRVVGAQPKSRLVDAVDQILGRVAA